MSKNKRKKIKNRVLIEKLTEMLPVMIDLRNERKLALLKAWEAEKQANEEAMKHLPQVA